MLVNKQSNEMKHMKPLRLIAWLIVVVPASVFSQPLSPQYGTILIPAKGFIRLSDEVAKCDISPSDPQIEKASAKFGAILLNDCMSAGSGHWHTISIGYSKGPNKSPIRGVKLTTSTLGWITLGSYNGKALPWLMDVDQDGVSEVVIWESFPDSALFANNTYGLVPWVYKSDSKSLRFDQFSTCLMLDTTINIYQQRLREINANDSIRGNKPNRIKQAYFSRIIQTLRITKEQKCSAAKPTMSNR